MADPARGSLLPPPHRRQERLACTSQVALRDERGETERERGRGGRGKGPGPPMGLQALQCGACKQVSERFVKIEEEEANGVERRRGEREEETEGGGDGRRETGRRERRCVIISWQPSRRSMRSRLLLLLLEWEMLSASSGLTLPQAHCFMTRRTPPGARHVMLSYKLVGGVKPKHASPPAWNVVLAEFLFDVVLWIRFHPHNLHSSEMLSFRLRSRTARRSSSFVELGFPVAHVKGLMERRGGATRREKIRGRTGEAAGGKGQRDSAYSPNPLAMSSAVEFDFRSCKGEFEGNAVAVEERTLGLQISNKLPSSKDEGTKLSLNPSEGLNELGAPVTSSPHGNLTETHFLSTRRDVVEQLKGCVLQNQSSFDARTDERQNGGGLEEEIIYQGSLQGEPHGRARSTMASNLEEIGSDQPGSLNPQALVLRERIETGIHIKVQRCTIEQRGRIV
eukprot:766557-Hanusia_phi.AAC.2